MELEPERMTELRAFRAAREQTGRADDIGKKTHCGRGLFWQRTAGARMGRGRG